MNKYAIVYVCTYYAKHKSEVLSESFKWYLSMRNIKYFIMSKTL